MVSPMRVGAAAVSPAPPPTKAEPDHASSSELQLLRAQLQQAHTTAAEQTQRIKDLEARLLQREDHIDTLTRSLIDLGQHSSKYVSQPYHTPTPQLQPRLQQQVQTIVNEPRNEVDVSGIDASAIVSPNQALQGLEQKQAMVKQLDDAIIDQFETKLSSRPNSAQDMGAVLSAIEDHRVRADQIVDLNKQSMGLLKSFYQAEAQEAVPTVDQRAPSPVRLSSTAENVLATGEWVQRFDEALQRTYYYNEARNRVSWNLEDVAEEEGQLHKSAQSVPTSRAPPPSMHTTVNPPMSPPLPGENEFAVN